MNPSKKIAVFILSHGRPDRVITVKTLRRQGYTGEIFIICDDEDKTLEDYKKNFGDKVIVFSKKDYEGKFDIMDNFAGNNVIVYARNACQDIARNLGLDYFFEYEDDYTKFHHRFIEEEALRGVNFKNFDLIIYPLIDYLESAKLTTLAFAQGGDLIGGVRDFVKIGLKRKAMNTFLFKVNKNPKDDLIFLGRMNDDVNTYLINGKIGKLFFQIKNICVVQLETQSNAGGNTEIYKKYGTYVKSFYSVMAEPSCCKITLMGTSKRRIHHKIAWNNAVPKIVREELKK